MRLLLNQIQPYPWGSPTAIAELTGRPNPDGGPQAELWMGAHPAAPSEVDAADGRVTLAAVIAADPEGQLGAGVLKRFGPRLPFLLKVLAARKALSIQLHPDRAGAESGFAAEEARGLPLKDPERVYVDDWPKPEVLCALTPFEVLAGLRPAAEAARVLAGLGLPELAPVCAVLAADPSPDTVAAALARLLSWPVAQRADLVARVVAAAAVAGAESGEFASAYEAVHRMSADHPGDIGLVCSLLLNHLVVEPGQALFMGAGGVHAYIQGTGVELMASSDNVIRAGLTPKHIDIPELLKVLDPTVPVPVLAAVAEGPGVEVFDTPVPEFRLRRITAGAPGTDALAVTVPGDGEPRILLCVDGAAELHGAGGETLALGKGASCFLGAEDVAVTVSGPGVLFLASPGI
ncbi:MAG TPA: mannose-6-phosphate isomerase, class I [Actinocrinis sp.]|nr:mannose-6-phosphate isomerase, class I [Actinocrinis sp.]